MLPRANGYDAKDFLRERFCIRRIADGALGRLPFTPVQAFDLQFNEYLPDLGGVSRTAGASVCGRDGA
jgi:hypothetical protein